jgi:hypothetical protein
MRRLIRDPFLHQWMAVWTLALLWGEAGVFMYKRCAWADDGGAAGAGIVAMADLQLHDDHSYTFAPRGSMLLYLIELVSDAFMRRAFRFAVRPLDAAAHIYAGDLFENLRAADEATRREYVRRFERIVPTMKLGMAANTDETPSLVVEGNHDVGLRDAYSPTAQAWFASHFLNRTHRVHRTVSVDIVMINAPALVSLPRSHPEVVASLQAAADPSSCRPEVACILVSHIPLWRKPGEGCRGAPGGAGHDWRAKGGGSHEITVGDGYSYLNLLPESLSHEILWAAAGGRGRWDAVLSGDDHSWCVHTHHRPAGTVHAHTDRGDEVVEFTVGTMSWLQGATSSWVLLLQCPRPSADQERPSREEQARAGGGVLGAEGGKLADVVFGRGLGCVARPCALPKERHVIYSYCGLGALTLLWCIGRMAWGSVYGPRRRLAGLVGECGRQVAVLLVWALSLWVLLLCLV